MAVLDRFLLEWDVNEVHSVDLTCSPERALEAVLALPVASDPLVGLLLRLRGLPSTVTLGTAIQSMGFEVLARSSVEIVAGATGTPWRRSGRMRPFAATTPGTVRMAIDFRAEPMSGGCRLSTETRVQAVDAEALRRFRHYWRLVGPFSALIRRRWLAAVSRSVAA